MSNLYQDAGPEPADGRKVFLATTAYDSPDASYTFSIARTREALHKAGFPTSYTLLQGNCHVDDARNTVVADFLKSDCSELVFLDADVSWQPEHLVRLCSHDLDLVGGVYPYRRDGADHMPVRMKAGHIIPDESGLIEVEGLPTGFLRIRRVVLETLAEKAQWFRRGDLYIPLIFERTLHNGGRMGGDIGFCFKWAEAGGKLYADTTLTLGHCGKHVLRDSLAATLRRQMGTTYRFIADKIRDETATLDDYDEALQVDKNEWAAGADFLSLCTGLARKAQGPILEIGSGITTACMAAARPDLNVWAVEHSPVYAEKLREMAVLAGVDNIMLVSAPLKDGWYDLSAETDLPERFSVAVVDGPPRLLGDRLKFFDHFSGRFDAALFDDADDLTYRGKLTEWAAANGFKLEADKRAALMTRA